jgi:hypothetical protein
MRLYTAGSQKTTIEHPLTFVATTKISALPVAIPTREAPNVIRSLIKNVWPQMLVSNPEFTDLAGRVKKELEELDNHVAIDEH